MKASTTTHLGALVLIAAVVGALSWVAAASADHAAALDAKAREASQQIVSSVKRASLESRTFAETIKSIASFDESRRTAERGRGPASSGIRVAQEAAKEETKYRRSGGKNKQTLKNALAAYDRAIASASELTRAEATITASHKGMAMSLHRVESSAKKIKAEIGDLNKGVVSLERTVRSMKTQRVDPNLVARWERQLAKAKSDRDKIAALNPVIDQRVQQARKIAAIPASPAAAQKKIADADARHSSALSKLESLRAKRAVLAFEASKGLAGPAVAQEGMTVMGCDIQKVDWKNFKYDDGEGGTLRNGETAWDTDDEQRSNYLTDVAYGDLDDNGKREAYVWVRNQIDWSEVGSMGSENLYAYAVNAKCRLEQLGLDQFSIDVATGKIVGNHYVVIDEMDERRVEWFFADGKLTRIEKPLK